MKKNYEHPETQVELLTALCPYMQATLGDGGSPMEQGNARMPERSDVVF